MVCVSLSERRPGAWSDRCQPPAGAARASPDGWCVQIRSVSVASKSRSTLAPLGWGLLTDLLAGFRIGTEVQLNGFVILYIIIALIMIPSLILLGRVQEERAASSEELIRELVRETPWRSITRWWNRRPFA